MKTYIFTYKHRPTNHTTTQHMEIDAPDREAAIRRFKSLFLNDHQPGDWKCIEKTNDDGTIRLP